MHGNDNFPHLSLSSLFLVIIQLDWIIYSMDPLIKPEDDILRKGISLSYFSTLSFLCSCPDSLLIIPLLLFPVIPLLDR